jgi:hypothetical protein
MFDAHHLDGLRSLAPMGAVLREIVIDCIDPTVVADFWGAALDWQVQVQGDARWMSASGAPFPDLVLVFVPVPEPKQGKNRVHIDLSPVGCDRDAEVERLLALGATRADVGQGDTPWTVLADPEGNELCVLGRRADGG